MIFHIHKFFLKGTVSNVYITKNYGILVAFFMLFVFYYQRLTINYLFLPIIFMLAFTVYELYGFDAYRKLVSLTMPISILHSLIEFADTRVFDFITLLLFIVLFTTLIIIGYLYDALYKYFFMAHLHARYLLISITSFFIHYSIYNFLFPFYHNYSVLQALYLYSPSFIVTFVIFPLLCYIETALPPQKQRKVRKKNAGRAD